MQGQMRQAVGLLAMVAALAVVRTAAAAVVASDNASNSAYNGGWANGSNGGTGFGPWALSPQPNSNNGGFFIGSSANNGDGGANVPPPTDIDVLNKAWGLYANTGTTSEAVRPLTGSLDVGQRILVNFDNGFIDDLGVVAFRLLGGGATRLEFGFVGGQQHYFVTDDGGTRDAGINFTDEGLAIDVGLTSDDAYALLVTPSGGVRRTFTGTLSGAAGSGVDAIAVVNNNAGSFGQRDAFLNSLRVVPEPGTLGLLAVGAGGLLRRRTGN